MTIRNRIRAPRRLAPLPERLDDHPDRDIADLLAAVTMGQHELVRELRAR